MPYKDKEARKKYNAEYQKKNREKIYKKHQEWVANNREKLIAYHRDYNIEWYQKNKEKHDLRGKVWGQDPENKKKRVRYVQKYVSSNKEKVYTYGKSYNRTVAGAYRSYKSHAQRRNKLFEITEIEFAKIITKPCTYCGESDERIGVDRIDNTVGYTKENSTPCCKMCNYMKNKYSVTDFLSHIRKIYIHNAKV